MRIRSVLTVTLMTAAALTAATGAHAYAPRATTYQPPVSVCDLTHNTPLLDALPPAIAESFTGSGACIGS